jgi:hypothetical protein
VQLRLVVTHAVHGTHPPYGRLHARSLSGEGHGAKAQATSCRCGLRGGVCNARSKERKTRSVVGKGATSRLRVELAKTQHGVVFVTLVIFIILDHEQRKREQ